MPEEQKSGFSAAFLIATAIMALLFAGVYLYTQHSLSAGSSAPPPLPMAAAEQAYAPRIHFTGFKRVRAANFLDQEVTILFGNVTNNGDRPVHEIQVQLEFKDVFNQRSEEHTSELQSLAYLVCRLLLEKKKKKKKQIINTEKNKITSHTIKYK